MSSLKSAMLVTAVALLAACSDRAEVKRIGEVDGEGRPKASAVTGGTISGTIDVDEALKAKLQPSTDVLYIFARQGDGGPPVAVKRYVPGQYSFPLRYELSASDMMLRQPGSVFAGEMRVFARISRSGDAIGAPGDIEGYYPGNPVSPPAGSVDFKIATERL